MAPHEEEDDPAVYRSGSKKAKAADQPEKNGSSSTHSSPNDKANGKDKSPKKSGTQKSQSGTQPRASSSSDIDMSDPETEVVWINGKRQRGQVYVPVATRTKYYVRKSKAEIRKAKAAKDGDANTQDVNMDADDEDGDDSDAEEVLDLEDPQVRATYYDEVEREGLVRGFKYGTSYAPCPEGQFPKLNTKKGIDFCAFFKRDNVRMRAFASSVFFSMFTQDVLTVFLNVVSPRARHGRGSVHLGRPSAAKATNRPLIHHPRDVQGEGLRHRPVG